ncbi:hypothetical protein F0562_020956 [Nyssa sinensis]|uniref:Aminotransferase-like plant mobile domain-containing protein n=1 Tax=Nyssa sinensis TaxID=561372 RepID=A0A5J5BVR5_9ASTE|nr:hypothetical protein F0562_020956 [Nyssa sinensis]
MGFESLLHISCRTLRLSFLSHVIDRFDPESQMLIIDGGNPVHITSEDVGKVLGIPYTGKRIPEVISNKKMELLKSRFPNRSFRELHRLTVEELESREVFMQSYLLYILGCFLCPTMNDEASSLVFPAISIASKAREYDWASYVLKWLVDQLKSYKKKILQGGTTSGTGGCLFFLMIFYLRQLEFYNVETDSMIGWTDKVVDQCIAKAMQTIPSSHINRGGSSSFSVPRSRSTQRFQTPELNSLFQQIEDQFKSTEEQFKSTQDQFKSTIYQQLFLVDQRLQPSEAGPSSSMPNMPAANFEDAGGRDSEDERGPDLQDIGGHDSENERCQDFQDVGGQDLEDERVRDFSIDGGRVETSAPSSNIQFVYTRRRRKQVMVDVEGSSLHDVSAHASFSPYQEEATGTPQEHEPIMDLSIGHPDGSSTHLIQRRRRRPIQPGPQIQDPYESAPVVVIQQLTQQEDLLYQWCMKKDDFLILSTNVIHIPPSPSLMRSDIIDSMKARGHVSYKVMDVARTVIMERESNKARTRKGFSRRFVHIFDPQFGDKRAFSKILRGEKECATIREKEIDRKYGMKLESLILKGTENMGSSHSQIIKVPIS